MSKQIRLDYPEWKIFVWPRTKNLKKKKKKISSREGHIAPPKFAVLWNKHINNVQYFNGLFMMIEIIITLIIKSTRKQNNDTITHHPIPTTTINFENFQWSCCLFAPSQIPLWIILPFDFFPKNIQLLDKHQIWKASLVKKHAHYISTNVHSFSLIMS